MTEIREAAGLTWKRDGDGWAAENELGSYRLVEVGAGQWTDFWWPVDESCGCGIQARGGRDFDDFDRAAAAVAALARDLAPGL
ncbi:MAG: hypothetical protein H7841_10825, partial [Magnetospirillum sp. WYHS-4]